MAGMPQQVLNRANQMLRQLESLRDQSSLGKKNNAETKSSPIDGYQLSFIQLEDPLLLQIKEDILNTDINTLTPVEALMKLNEIKKLFNK
jgi:DNA mismatch repair protein MutS